MRTIDGIIDADLLAINAGSIPVERLNALADAGLIRRWQVDGGHHWEATESGHVASVDAEARRERQDEDAADFVAGPEAVAARRERRSRAHVLALGICGAREP